MAAHLIILCLQGVLDIHRSLKDQNKGKKQNLPKK